MMRHLKNVNELVLYAAVSCGVAFLSRLIPGLWFPLLLLRLAILGYCIYVIGWLEQKRHVGLLVGVAMFLGSIGGYWDLLEVYFRYNPNFIMGSASVILIALGVTCFGWNEYRVKKDAKTK